MPAIFTPDDITAWQRDGAVLLQRFFSGAEIDPVARDFEYLFGHLQDAAGSGRRNTSGATQVNPLTVSEISKQAEFNTYMPFHCSPALNLIGLHPTLIKFARAALEVHEVRLYQCLAWPKFAEHTDFNQPLHMDYHDHTLTAVGEALSERSVNFSIYVSEVSDGRGAIRYVPRLESDKICGVLRPDEPDAGMQDALRKAERSGAGPRGSVFVYTTDVYHRGTDLTVPKSHRYTLFVGYKAATNDAFSGNPWPGLFHARMCEARDCGRKNPAEYFFEYATPEQLACLNIPPPGHPFWTKSSLARAQRRWPMWNLDLWRQSV